MSEKPSNPFDKSVNGDSGLLGFLGKRMVESPSWLVDKQGDKWEPYVGPRGGEGWQNRETGEVIYGDLQSVAEEDESVQAPEEPESEQNEYPESTVDVDRDDVQRGDYIYVDGEDGGYLDSVERVQDGSVIASFEDGRSFRIREGMDVRVNDDPPVRPEDVDETVYEFDEALGKVQESVEVTDRGSSAWVDNDGIENVIADNVSRCKSKVIADSMLDDLEKVTAQRGMSYHAENRINLRPNDHEETMSHEVGHALLKSNGLETPEFANVMALTHNTMEGLDTSHMGKGVLEAIQDIFNDGKKEISYEYVEAAEKHFDGGEILDVSFLSMNVDPDAPEEIVQLGEEVNKAFRDQFEQIEEEGITPNLIQDQYAVTNAHETWAAVHEELQRDGVSKKSMKVLYEDYPDLLSAYFELFDPNSFQKREIKKLYENSGPNGSIEEDPFPEVQL